MNTPDVYQDEAVQGSFLSTKSFYNYPCAHRQWRHKGNCALVHGYSRSFHFQFAALTRDACGFVVDFGNLKWVKDFLEANFDHTLLLEADDPLLPAFREIESQGGALVVTCPFGVGMEGTAEWVATVVNSELRKRSQGRCRVVSLEVKENDKNSAIYRVPEPTNPGWL